MKKRKHKTKYLSLEHFLLWKKLAKEGSVLVCSGSVPNFCSEISLQSGVSPDMLIPNPATSSCFTWFYCSWGVRTCGLRRKFSGWYTSPWPGFYSAPGPWLSHNAHSITTIPLYSVPRVFILMANKARRNAVEVFLYSVEF